MIPGYRSPFRDMPERLVRKMSRKKAKGTKSALAPSEVKSLLKWLTVDTSIEGRRNHAIVFLLVTSGLRVSELCSLTWKDIEHVERRWTASFIGKGDKQAVQELYGPAVRACLTYFKRYFDRDPRPMDSLFYTLPKYAGCNPRPLYPVVLWVLIKEIGKQAKEASVIKREFNWSPHLFRRSYATCLYKSGMKLKAVQAKTRHSSIDTLAKHYIDDTEPAQSYLRKALA
jgi:site-specific recombinase XerD